MRTICQALGWGLCATMLLLGVVDAAEEVFRGELAEGDKVHKDRKAFIDYYVVRAKAGQLMTVSMIGTDEDNRLDTYLIVTGPSGQKFVNDDAEGGGSRVTFRVPESGEWEIGATAYGEGEAGPYVVKALRQDLKLLFGKRENLEEGDDVLLKGGELYDKYPLQVEPGKTYLVMAASSEFDTFLSVHYPGGFINNDDAEGAPNTSMVLFSPTEAGEATIVITSSYSKQEGRYQLAAYEATDSQDEGVPGTSPPAR